MTETIVFKEFLVVEKRACNAVLLPTDIWSPDELRCNSGEYVYPYDTKY